MPDGSGFCGAADPLYTIQRPAPPESRNTWREAIPQAGVQVNRGVTLVVICTVTVCESLHATIGSKPRLSEHPASSMTTNAIAMDGRKRTINRHLECRGPRRREAGNCRVAPASDCTCHVAHLGIGFDRYLIRRIPKELNKLAVWPKSHTTARVQQERQGVVSARNSFHVQRIGIELGKEPRQGHFNLGGDHCEWCWFSLGHQDSYGPSNGSRLSCGALKKDSFPNLRAPPASSAC